MNNAKLTFDAIEIEVLGRLLPDLARLVPLTDQSRFANLARRFQELRPAQANMISADHIALLDSAIAVGRRERLPILTANDLTQPDVAAMHRLVATIAAAAAD